MILIQRKGMIQLQLSTITEVRALIHNYVSLLIRNLYSFRFSLLVYSTDPPKSIRKTPLRTYRTETHRPKSTSSR